MLPAPEFDGVTRGGPRGGFVAQLDARPDAVDAPGQLYDLATDPGETRNLYFEREDKRRELQSLLEHLKSSGRSAPRNRKPLGIQSRKTG